MGLSLIANYLICIGRNQKQFARAFEPANHRNLPAINRSAYNLISGSARVAREFSPYSAVCYCHFDIGKGQVILSHFLEEMRDCKFIIAIPNLLSDALNNRQATLSAPRRHFLTAVPYHQESYHQAIHIRNKKFSRSTVLSDDIDKHRFSLVLKGGKAGGLALISRQSFLSRETKFLARLWKDLVFTVAGISVDLGHQFSQGHDLLPYLCGIVRVEGESDIGLKVFQRLGKAFQLQVEQPAVPDLLD